MSTHIYYHGANGDSILSIMATGVMTPNEKNEIFLSRFHWDSCFMHGADRKRKASFVIKVQAEIPDELKRVFMETPGVQDTAVLQTKDPLPVKVLELFVRRPGEDGPSLDYFIGETAIKLYLGG